MANRPKWFVSACVCECGKVALTVMHRNMIDRDASLTAEGDNEVVACGDDWRMLYQSVALEMAERTGRPISGNCTNVFIREDAEARVIEDEITEWAYGLAIRLPSFGEANR